jgi:hypothetical protein
LASDINKDNSIILFNQKEVRRKKVRSETLREATLGCWDDEAEFWYFSIIDVVSILTDTTNPKRYWSDLKSKLKQEGSEVYDNIVHLKMIASDGKRYKTDCFNTEDLLRTIQSIPSPKDEPFKLWLAKVGYECIEETEDPELAFERAMQTCLKKGHSKEWINQRLKSIEVRKEPTDEWQDRGMKQGLEYAILTDEITKAWSDKSIREYKKLRE